MCSCTYIANGNGNGKKILIIVIGNIYLVRGNFVGRHFRRAKVFVGRNTVYPKAAITPEWSLLYSYLTHSLAKLP